MKSRFKLQFDTVGRMSEDDLTGMWLQVKEAIGEIFAENSSLLSFEELYRSVSPSWRAGAHPTPVPRVEPGWTG